MPDRERRREPENEDRLERELEEIGSQVEYPPTPDLARSVSQRLRDEVEDAPARRRSRNFSPRWAVAAAALVLIFSLPLFSPDARNTLSGVFSSGDGAAGGAAEVGTVANEDSPSTVDSAGEASTGVEKDFGAKIPLERARERLDGRLVLPRERGLKEPEEVYALGEPNESSVALIYPSRPDLPPLGETGAGLVLVELPGTLRSTYPTAGKKAGAEEVRVGEGKGYRVMGRENLPPKLASGVRPSSEVLIWEKDGLTLRLETALPDKEEIQLAESVR